MPTTVDCAPPCSSGRATRSSSPTRSGWPCTPRPRRGVASGRVRLGQPRGLRGGRRVYLVVAGRALELPPARALPMRRALSFLTVLGRRRRAERAHAVVVPPRRRRRRRRRGRGLVGGGPAVAGRRGRRRRGRGRRRGDGLPASGRTGRRRRRPPPRGRPGAAARDHGRPAGRRLRCGGPDPGALRCGRCAGRDRRPPAGDRRPVVRLAHHDGSGGPHAALRARRRGHRVGLRRSTGVHSAAVDATGSPPTAWAWPSDWRRWAPATAASWLWAPRSWRGGRRLVRVPPHRWLHRRRAGRDGVLGETVGLLALAAPMSRRRGAVRGRMGAAAGLAPRPSAARAAGGSPPGRAVRSVHDRLERRLHRDAKGPGSSMR